MLCSLKIKTNQYSFLIFFCFIDIDFYRFGFFGILLCIILMIWFLFLFLFFIFFDVFFTFLLFFEIFLKNFLRIFFFIFISIFFQFTRHTLNTFNSLLASNFFSCCCLFKVTGDLILRLGIFYTFGRLPVIRFSIVRFGTSLIHFNHSLGMGVYAQTDQFIIVIENTIEMFHEQIPKQIISIVMLIQWILSNSKLANLITLMQICFRLKFKDCIINLKANWLY